MRPHEQCLSDCNSMYAMDVLYSVDMMPAKVQWLNRRPHSTIVGEERMSVSGVFMSLEHYGYLKTDWTTHSIKVTEKGTEALRSWNNAEAGL